MDAMSLLDTLDTASSNVSVRDKTMKIAMYGSRMLLGFYGSKLSPEVYQGLSNTRDAATISRKAFRIMKSISSIANILRMLGPDPSCKNSSDPGIMLFRLLEETFYSAFYYYDNKYLLARLGITSFDMNKENDKANFTWFLAEACGLGALLLQYRAYLTRLRSVRWRIARMKVQRQNSPPMVQKKIPNPVTAAAPLTFDMAYLENELARLESLQNYFIAKFMESGMNVFISGNSSRMWEKYLGVRAPDSVHGLFGLLASVVALYSKYAFDKVSIEGEELVNTW